MSKSRIGSIRLIAPFVAFLVVPTLHGLQQTTGTAVLAGRVLEVPSGNGVGGAVVALSLAAPTPAAAPSGQPPAATRRAVAVANDDGRFVFRDLPAGTYTISSTFAGLAPGASGRRRPAGPSRPITVADGARINDLVISMWRLATISGVVRDDKGEPFVGLAVWALRRVMNGGRQELTLADGGVESADDRGHYRISNLLPGTYVITAYNATHSIAVSTVDSYHGAVSAGTSAAMRAEFMQTGGLMVDKAGLVLGDWQVSVSSGLPQPLPGPNGSLLLQPRVIYPNASSVAEATMLTLATGEDRTGIDLVVPLVAGMRVSGILSGPSGPAANHGMRLVPAVTGDVALDTPVAYCTTDAAGRFAFLGVPAGSYIVRAYRVPPSIPVARQVPPAAGAPPIPRVEITTPSATPAPALFADVPVAVGSSHVDGLSVALEPGARLSGRIVFEGATPPPAAAVVQKLLIVIRPLFGALSGISADARADADGRFTTTGYPPGRYVVQNVIAPTPEWTLASVRIGGVDAAGQAFAIGNRDIDDVVITFTDKSITLSGDVRAADAGVAPEATVVVFPADFQAWLSTGMSPRRLATAVTSATGAYQIKMPLPGDYMVVAVPPDVTPDVDAEFVKRFSAGAVRISLAAGETKTQALTVSRSK